MLALLLAATILVPGPEKILTQSQPQFVAAPGSQDGTSIASNGSEFVVTWTTNSHGFAARLSSSGQLIDPTGVPLGLTSVPMQSSAFFFGGPIVAGVGDHFVVIGGDGERIRSERLDAGLTIVSTHDLGFPGQPSFIAIDGDAQSAFVVLDVSGRVYGRLLDPEGAPMTDWLQLGAVDDPNHMAMIRDASSYLLLIARPSDATLYGRRIGSNGHAGDWKKIEGETFTDLAVLRAGRAGSKDVVAWHALHAKDLNMSIIDPQTLTASERLVLALPARLDSVFGREGTATVLYDEITGIGVVPHAKTIDLATRTVLADTVLSSFLSLYPAAAAVLGDIDIVARSTADPFARVDVVAQVFSHGVPSGAPMTVSRSATEQSSPDIAFGRSVGLVVYADKGVRGVRIAHDGTPLDAQPIQISDTPGTPHVSFDGERFVVVWQRGAAGVVARRFDESGVAVDAQPVVINPDLTWTPAIACGPKGCLLAWGCNDGQMCSSTLMRDGTVGASVQLSNDRAGGAAVNLTPGPDVAYGGGAFAVGWRTIQWSGDGAPFYSGTSVMLVTPNGSPVKRIWLRDFITGPVTYAPQIAWNGSEFLAAWIVDDALWVQPFSADGMTLGAPRFVLTIDKNALLSDVSFVNGSWIVAYQLPTFPRMAPPVSSLIYLSPSLSAELLFTFKGDVADPALPSDGTPLVVYRRAAEELPFGGAYRVFARPMIAPKLRAVRR